MVVCLFFWPAVAFSVLVVFTFMWRRLVSSIDRGGVRVLSLHETLEDSRFPSNGSNNSRSRRSPFFSLPVVNLKISARSR